MLWTPKPKKLRLTRRKCDGPKKKKTEVRKEKKGEGIAEDGGRTRWDHDHRSKTIRSGPLSLSPPYGGSEPGTALRNPADDDDAGTDDDIDIDIDKDAGNDDDAFGPRPDPEAGGARWR